MKTYTVCKMKFTIFKEIIQAVDGQPLSWGKLIELANNPQIVHVRAIDYAALDKQEKGKLKKQLPYFIPSTSTVRNLASITQAMLTGFVLDLDEIQCNLFQLRDRLMSVGIEVFLIYTSISHTVDNPRYRIVIPTKGEMSVEEWEAISNYLNDVLFTEADACGKRAAQGYLLPAKTIDGDYQYLVHNDGELLDVSEDTHPVVIAATNHRQVAEAARKAKPIPHNEIIQVEGQISVIAAYVDELSLVEKMLSYGYKQVSKTRFQSPYSQSGTAGVCLFFNEALGKWQFYSHHTNDPLGGKACDVFDLYCHFEHAGDINAALKAIGDSWMTSEGISINQHNQRLYAKSREPEQTPLTFDELFSGSEDNSPMPEQSLLARSINLASHAPDNLLIKIAREQAKACSFPENSSVLATLAAFSAAAGLGFCMQYPNGDRLPIGLYVAIGQPPSTAKSRLLKALSGPYQNAIRRENARRAEAVSSELEKNKEAEKENSDKGSEDIIYMGHVITDTTPEALERKLNQQGGYFAIQSSEQGSIDSMLGSSLDKGRKNNNDLFLKGFNGEFHSSERVTRGGYEGIVHGSMCVITQPEVIDTIIKQSNGQGVAERVLMLAEPNLLGTRNHMHWYVPNVLIASDYETAVSKLVKNLERLITPELEELTTLSISTEGWEEINRYRNEIEPKLCDGGELSSAILRGAFGKVDIQIMKISGLLYLAECEAKVSSTNVAIGNQYVKQATNIVDELLTGLIQASEKSGDSGHESEDEAIIKAFANKKELTLRELQMSRKNVKPFKNMSGKKSEAIINAVQRLIEKEVLIAIQKDYSKGGKITTSTVLKVIN